MALIDKLREWWKLGEASGNRVGSHASTVLSSNNSVSREYGRQGKGAGFATASSRYLSAADATIFRYNGTTTCWSFWVKFASVSADQQLVTKDTDSPANSRDYTIDFVDSGGGRKLRAYWNGGAGANIVANNASVSAGVWYFVVVKLSDVGGGTYEISMSVNGNAFQSSSDASAPQTTSAEFRVGARQYSGFEGYADCTIDELAIWDQDLSIAEVLHLYRFVTSYEDLSAVTETNWHPTHFPVPYVSNPIIAVDTADWKDSQIYDFNIIPNPRDSSELLMYATGMAAPVQTGEQSAGMFRAAVSDPFTWTEEGGAGNGQVLVPTGSVGDFDENSIRVCSVIYNEDTDEIWMYYNGAVTNGTDNKIGLAIADPDTPDTFTRYGSNPILTAAGNGINDGGFVQMCSVVPPWVSGLSYWVMVYESRPGGGVQQFLSATSADGLSWTKTGSGSLLSPKPDGVNFTGPEYTHLHMLNGRCYNIFEAGSASIPYAIYAAPGITPEGPFVSKLNDGIPILPPSGVAASFDETHTATPSLVEIGGKLYLFYCGTNTSNPYIGQWSAGVAVYQSGDFQDAFADTFTDSNATALSTHDASWQAVTGTFQIQGNKAVPNSNANDDQATVDAGVSDAIVRCTVVPRFTDVANQSNPGIVLRGSDATHLWLVQIDAGNGNITLYENVGSGYVSLQAVNYTFSDNTAYALMIRCHRAGITVFVDGVAVMIELAAASNLTATEFGIRLGKLGTPPGDCSFDDFSVQEFVETSYAIPVLDQGMLTGGQPDRSPIAVIGY